MKKNLLNLWLLAALVCGLSLSVTSCHDDDNEMSPEEQEQKAIEQAEEENSAYSVLDNLANLSEAPADFLSGSYQPSIGVADDGDESTRIVNTNDMETAAKRFADLVGAEITEDTQTYTWSNDAVGTMTYTKSSDGRSWATVDVNIKQIRGLNKIIYRSPEQADNNGKFDGTAYYRFGDIVSKKNADGNEEIWICVRPCFGPEGKEESHWVTISSLPKANVFTYHSDTNNSNYALPTKIGDNHEHSQNFAEMLFAICFPEEWENNIINNPKTGLFSKGIPMFNDFDKANIKYHRQFFWQRVQKAWSDSTAVGSVIKQSVLSAVFGREGSLKGLQKLLKSADGLNLLTNGYSWWTISSNYPTLYRYRFVNGEGKESNMHKEPIKHNALKNYHSVSAEVIKSNIWLNCVTGYDVVALGGWYVPSFFGSENNHYIIRHATGAELSSDHKEKAKEPLKGVEEEYRYNNYYNITDLDEDPEVLESAEPVPVYENRGYYTVGDVVKDQDGNRWFCIQPSAFGTDISEEKNNYAYFVSYDRKAIGSDLKGIPTSKELAAQILYNLSSGYNIGMTVLKANDSSFKKAIENIQKHTGVYWMNLIAARDTLFETSHFGMQTIPCMFGSTLYRDADGNLCVLRLILDMTKESKAGNREFSWCFWDSYTADPKRIMKYSDLSDPEVISAYADDIWVKLPWYNPVTDEEITDFTGKLQPDEENTFGPEMCIYNETFHSLYTTLNKMIPKNMYREPLIAFAVKRVKDTGYQDYAFEDGTRYNHVSLEKDYSEFPPKDDVDAKLNIIFSYPTSVNNGFITLNGKPFDFKVTNKP